MITEFLYLRDWTQQNKTWFAAVQLEKRMMFIILTLIVAVAAFNLVSTLVMTVTDKRADIAILRTLGASPASIMGIFMVQGAMVGVIGTFAGLLLGLGVALNIDVIVPAIEHALGATFLPKLVQVAVQLLRRDAPLLLQLIQFFFQGRLLLGLVCGVAQNAHELLVELVEHIVRVAAAGSAARGLVRGRVVELFEQLFQRNLRVLHQRPHGVDGLKRGVQVHWVVDLEDSLANVVAAARGAADHLLVQDA